MSPSVLKSIAIYEDVLELESFDNVQLSFLIFYDESLEQYFIKSLDFSVDSEGQTLKECRDNIQEAIFIHLEDCEEGVSFFDPADKRYWDMFVNLPPTLN